MIKRRLIQSYIDKRGTSWNDPRVFMLDLQYHDIRLNRSLYYLLERSGAVERILDDDEVLKAKTEPPPDTRAKMRGEFIKLARQNSIQYDLDWSNIRLGNLLNVRVIWNNPFETDTEKVGRAGPDHPAHESAQDQPLEARDPVIDATGNPRAPVAGPGSID